MQKKPANPRSSLTQHTHFLHSVLPPCTWTLIKEDCDLRGADTSVPRRVQICVRGCVSVSVCVSPCPYVCCSLLLRVCPGFLAGVTGNPDATPAVCHRLPMCHSGGGCHHVPLTASRAQYKHAAAYEFPDCILPGSQTTSPSPFRPQTHRFLHSGVIKASRGSRPTCLGHGISAHTPPQAGNPLSPPSAGSTLGWLSGKRGLSGTELSLCSVTGTPWFCPPEDSTSPPPSASPGQGNL